MTTRRPPDSGSLAASGDTPPADADSLVHVPGRAGADERGEVTRSLTLDRADDLALHLDLVGGPLDGSEHADRCGHGGRRREPRERERERRALPLLVVHHQPLDTDVGDVHDLALRELVQHHAALAVGAEADGLAVY